MMLREAEAAQFAMDTGLYGVLLIHKKEICNFKPLFLFQAHGAATWANDAGRSALVSGQPRGVSAAIPWRTTTVPR